jgi:hypothetical protein
MLNSAQDAVRQIITSLQETPTIAELKCLLSEKKIFAKAFFSSPNGDFLTLDLPTMILAGLEDFNIEVALSTNLRDVCKIDLMSIPAAFHVKDWERMLIGSFILYCAY